MNRRSFIKNAACSAMGSTTLLSSLSSLGAINGLVNSQGDYKAMVCILLAGGLDSFNMLIPTGASGGDTGFSDYLTARTDLAFTSPNDLLSLPNTQISSFRHLTGSYQSFGLHPGMPGIQEIYQEGKLAFLANVGTLVEPLANKSEFESGLKKVPLGIYSHSDQIMQWQTSVPQSRDAVGLGGRIADLLNAQNANAGVSMNISLAGKNVFQRGNTITEYAISNNVDPNNVGLRSFPSWWNNSGLLQQIRQSALDSLVSQEYANILQKTYNTTAKSSFDAFDIFRNALMRQTPILTTFPTTNLAQSLLAIAKVMSVREYLGARRQIFFVQYGGWDMHDDLLNGLNQRLPVVSSALHSFYRATKELGIQDQVTTFTISDFARTITSNGQGSDHAWGGNSMIMGGAVRGGRVVGAYPRLAINNTNPFNVSFRGNFIPAVSTDEMYAELALWYGVSPTDLPYILPNIGNFYSYSPTQRPVGFMV